MTALPGLEITCIHCSAVVDSFPPVDCKEIERSQTVCSPCQVERFRPTQGTS